MTLGDLEAKFTSFGWASTTINGHSFDEIARAVEWAKKVEGPHMIIAKTVKGKGVKFMENGTRCTPYGHYENCDIDVGNVRQGP